MSDPKPIFLPDEEATLAFGAALARALEPGSTVFLEGDLGAGKTTLVRGLLKGLGYPGRVKSPTYTLMEPYRVEGQAIYHFDLYRLGDPEELEYMGARDFFGGRGICLVEWPERGAGFLPAPDLVLRLEHLNTGRRVITRGADGRGSSILGRLAQG